MSPFSAFQAWVIVVSAAVTAVGTLARVYYDRRRDLDRLELDRLRARVVEAEARAEAAEQALRS